MNKYRLYFFLCTYLFVHICIYSREELPNDERKLQPKHSQELLDLASKMRMNTDSRKTIFCTLMSSNDYLDAFEKLVKLPLKSPVKEREMAFVLSMCCLKEPQFNPFYAHVSAKLIRQDRKFRMSFQVIVHHFIIFYSIFISHDKTLFTVCHLGQNVWCG